MGNTDADLRERIAAALREHQPPCPAEPDYPGDEYECCVDAVMCVLGDYTDWLLTFAEDHQKRAIKAEAELAALRTVTLGSRRFRYGFEPPQDVR